MILTKLKEKLMQDADLKKLYNRQNKPTQRAKKQKQEAFSLT